MPRSSSRRRIWHVGACDLAQHLPNGPGLILRTRPDDHNNFASLIAILKQLAPFAVAAQRNRLRQLDGLLTELTQPAIADRQTAGGGLLNRSVTYSIMRRVSRESVYTAHTIDLAAQVINEILATVPDLQTAYVDHVDRLDRLTLKALARAMLLLEDEHGFAWVWRSLSDPVATPHPEDDPYLNSRTTFLRQLLGLVVPTLQYHPSPSGLTCPQLQRTDALISDISVALVMQNYDACFLWCHGLSGCASVEDAAEVLRLKGLALANVNRIDAAIDSWDRAGRMTREPGRRAHLFYLQGLVEAKRCYDLEKSDTYYQRGLDELDRSADGASAALALERAWLLNGLALNQTLLGRRVAASDGRYQTAFRLVRQAFELVHDGPDPGRAYLRFNLLANSAFLFEIQEQYDLAIDLLHKAFDVDADAAASSKDALISTLAYRIGVLHYRARHFDEACTFLHIAAEAEHNTGFWPTWERILRALGRVLLARGEGGRAVELFRQGLSLCRAARSSEGTREHARGLVTALLLAGCRTEARDLLANLRDEEGLTFTKDGGTGKAGEELALEEIYPSPPSPKLPAYIPEIDLEGTPQIDLNRFLSGAMLKGTSVPQPWREPT